jgi:hypothetical protein
MKLSTRIRKVWRPEQGLVSIVSAGSAARVGKLWVEQGCRFHGNIKVEMFANKVGARSGMTQPRGTPSRIPAAKRKQTLRCAACYYVTVRQMAHGIINHFVL